MNHDFDTEHGGTGVPGEGGDCDGTGIMSYGHFNYDQWSTCSRSDFEQHYSGLNWGNGCLEDISGENAFQKKCNFMCSYQF